MSTLYNKETEGSLIGNWVEEHALKELTGTSRYDVRLQTAAYTCAGAKHTHTHTHSHCFTLLTLLRLVLYSPLTSHGQKQSLVSI